MLALTSETSKVRKIGKGSSFPKTMKDKFSVSYPRCLLNKSVSRSTRDRDFSEVKMSRSRPYADRGKCWGSIVGEFCVGSMR